jgi:hypothetical protein
MKCALCDKEFQEGEQYVIRVGVAYHTVVQDCIKKKKVEK